MSDIARWAAFDGGIAPHPYGKWILYDDHQAEVERLIAERDEARAEVERLRANGQGMFDSSRPSDEDIWREVFLRCVSEYITGDKRVTIADTMLAEYRKRWPR